MNDALSSDVSPALVFSFSSSADESDLFSLLFGFEIQNYGVLYYNGILKKFL